MNVVAVIQARMSSTRLPGKVLQEIAGRPLLSHVVGRMKAVSQINKVLVATSDERGDDAILSVAGSWGAEVFLGSESDVLDRYLKAATQARADWVVRVTGDCPLIDPDTVEEALKVHLARGADYTGNLAYRTFPRGLDVEVFSIETLRKAAQGGLEARHRNHVTPFIYENPQMFHVETLEAEGELRRPDLRLCVDTAQDLQLLREIYNRFYRPDQQVDVRQVIRWLDTQPYWRSFNARSEEEHLSRNAREGIRQVILQASYPARK